MGIKFILQNAVLVSDHQQENVSSDYCKATPTKLRIHCFTNLYRDTGEKGCPGQYVLFLLLLCMTMFK